jgi:hypothetical protein
VRVWHLFTSGTTERDRTGADQAPSANRYRSHDIGQRRRGGKLLRRLSEKANPVDQQYAPPPQRP